MILDESKAAALTSAQETGNSTAFALIYLADVLREKEDDTFEVATEIRNLATETASIGRGIKGLGDIAQWCCTQR